MPGKRIPDLTAIAGASTANDDNLVIFDTSEGTTKRILRSQLAAGLVGDLPYTPSGGIAATTVPTAIAELDTEKVAFTRLDDNDGASLVGFLQSGTGATGRSAQSKLRDIVSVKDFGAVGDGVTNDTTAIVNAINAASGKTLVVDPGVYSLATGSQTIVLENDLTIDCAGATFLNNNAASTTLSFQAKEVATPTFSGTSSRGALSITVNSTTGIQAGMLVFIDSTKTYETGYNYKQKEVHKVVSTTSTTITFSEPLVFGYDSATDGVTLSVRKNVSLTINGPLTVTYPSSSGGTGRVIDIRYLSNSVVNGLRSIDPQKRRGSGPDPVLVGESYNTTFNDSFFSGARYCVNVTNGSRNTSFKNVESIECWQPIDFNTASYNCFVQNIRGQDNVSTIASHPCFNLLYEDVYSEGDEAVLPRAVGVYVRNARLVTEFAMDSNGFSADVNLVSDIHSEFDFIFKDYVLIAPNASTTQGVGTNAAYRTAHFYNVDVGSLSVASNTSTECYVNECYVSSMNMRGNILFLDNTVIDAQHRQSVGTDAYAMTIANLEGLRVSNCEIRGGHQYLIANPVNAPSGITFTNTRISGITTGMFSGVVVGLTGVDILFSNCIGSSNTFDLPGTYVGGSRIKAENCYGLSDLENYKRGSSTATTDGNGNINIAHGIYATPTWADVVIRGDNTYVAQVQNITATNILVRVGNMASSGADVTSTSVTVFWEAAI